jgi:hypothetical protein
VASDGARRLMTKISENKYAAVFEGFIPTFRRVDFRISATDGKQYNLIGVMSWKGTLQVSLPEVVGK